MQANTGLEAANQMNPSIIDLTASPARESGIGSNKRPISEVIAHLTAKHKRPQQLPTPPIRPQAAPELGAAVPSPAPVPVAVPVPAPPRTGIAQAKKKPSASSQAHALLWICAAGKGQSRTWKAKALKVIGVYATKADAERKKEEIMSRYDCCGHGDIMVGGTWEDEIDLVIRPCEEVVL